MAHAGRTPLMAGNWKMNLDHLQATAPRAEAGLDPARTPSTTSARSRSPCCRRSPTCAACRPWSTATSSSCSYGAQDLSAHDAGAYTGEISGAFLAKLGCTYVVVGHSERRAVPRRGRRRRQRQGQGRASGTASRRSSASARASRSARRARTSRTRSPSSTAALAGVAAEQAAQRRRRLRAGLGDRHRRGRHPGGRPGGLRARSAPGSPSSTRGDAGRRQSGCSTAARSRPRNIAAIMAEADVDGALVGGAQPRRRRSSPRSAASATHAAPTCLTADAEPVRADARSGVARRVAVR